MAPIIGPRMAPDGPLPRVIDPMERAGPGLFRFKIRVTNNEYQGRTRYVLARTREDAEACYLAAEGLADPATRKARPFVDQYGPEHLALHVADVAPEPDLAVTELPD